VYGQLRWCVRVGTTVLDFGIEDEEMVDIELVEQDDYDEDDPMGCISFRVTDWKVMLKNAFREERALKALMLETEEDDYTYNHLEDSLRDMRRRRFRSKLDPKDLDESRYICIMDNMKPLWGKHTSINVDQDYGDIERAECNAVQTLMLLRKEASISIREREALDLIVLERSTMHKEIKEVDGLYKKWRENLLTLPNLSLEHLYIDEDLDPNPMTWSKEIMDRKSTAMYELHETQADFVYPS
jgi:hypothetical protein